MPTGYPKATVPPVFRGGLVAAADTAVVQETTVDRQSVPLSGSEGKPQPGQAQLMLPRVPSGKGYRVEIIDIWSNSTSQPTASVYIDSAAPQNEVDYSANAGHDIAYEQPPIYVPSGSQLLIVFSGLSANALVTARIQYAVTQFVAR